MHMLPEVVQRISRKPKEQAHQKLTSTLRQQAMRNQVFVIISLLSKGALSSFLDSKQNVHFQTHLFLPYSDSEGAYTKNLISFYVWNVLQGHHA